MFRLQKILFRNTPFVLIECWEPYKWRCILQYNFLRRLDSDVVFPVFAPEKRRICKDDLSYMNILHWLLFCFHLQLYQNYKFLKMQTKNVLMNFNNYFYLHWVKYYFGNSEILLYFVLVWVDSSKGVKRS